MRDLRLWFSPARLLAEGENPDYRFSLANERTFLAWLRTALGMYAGAFALEALSLPAATGWRLAAAGVFLVLGTLAAVQAWFGWSATESALRRNQPLPGLAVGGLIVVGIIVAVALVTIGIFV